MILGFCVSGSTVAVHIGDAGSNLSHLKYKFLFNNFFNTDYIVKGQTLNFMTSIDWWAIEMLTDILAWIGFSVKNIAKQAVRHCTFMTYWFLGCLKCKIVACTLKTKLLKDHRHGQSINHIPT